jgi:uncharacterized protein YfiM (DUF2279 family)
MKNISIVILVFCLSLPASSFSQDSLNYKSLRKKNIYNTIPVIGAFALTYTSGFVYANNNYYPDSNRVPFYFTNDNSGFLQVDKFQHAFGSYVESYLGYRYLRYNGVNKNTALIFGGTLGFFVQTPKEIIDGYYEGTGFSWGDALGNLAGSFFMIGQELLFNEQVIRYKFSFWRSPYADQANGLLGRNYFHSYSLDYNGHTYWFSLNANRFLLKTKLPDWVSISLGYSANGMFGPFNNLDSYNGVPIPETERYRQYLISLDIDWPKIKTNSKFLKFIFNGLVFIKIPFPAIELNSKGQIKGYLLYF